MSAARLLETARAAGLSLAVEAGNIVVEADGEPPPELIAELRQQKSELIAVLLPDAHNALLPFADSQEDRLADPAWWHDLYAERTGHWFHSGRRWHEAEALAWGYLENRWNLAYGERVSSQICAGCRRPIRKDAALDLIDGNRVHLADGYECLIRHGERWRGAATRALVTMGLSPPTELKAS